MVTYTQRPLNRPGTLFQFFNPVTPQTRGMNLPCEPSNGSKRNGTCITSEQCRTKGGQEAGGCGTNNAGICCLERHACGTAGAITSNSSAFANPENPDTLNDSQACIVTVNRLSNNNNICQIRLDFEEFELAPPRNGRCDTDQFAILGVPGIPVLCGSNGGQHIYIDFPTGVNTISLQVVTTGFDYQRKWRIRVSQIECNSPSIAPSGCFQYYTGTSGSFRSFNYDANFNSGYQRELNYGTCMRRESGFCGIRYTTAGAFQVGVADKDIPATATRPYGHSAANNNVREEEEEDLVYDNEDGEEDAHRVRRRAAPEVCPSDFLLIPNAFEEGKPIANNKFCGTKFNPEQGANAEAVVSSRIMPFVTYFFSDTNTANKKGRGFYINWQQTPCTS
uniref:CUB domain-containing protein n=1 Tax=Strigamia maritima TaxID=126957 RepID=T1IHV2_STRMM